jgi:hypothetical protein
MVTGLEKILKHFINGKEFSPGLIVNVLSVETDMYDNVRVVFDVDNVGGVPYNLLIVGVNLKGEIEKLSEYISFEPNHIYVSYVGQKKGIQDIMHIQGSEVPFSDIFYLTNSFKSELLHNLQDINQLPVNHHHGKKEHLKVLGKFIPRIGVSDFRDELFLDLTFRMNGLFKIVSPFILVVKLFPFSIYSFNTRSWFAYLFAGCVVIESLIRLGNFFKEVLINERASKK